MKMKLAAITAVLLGFLLHQGCAFNQRDFTIDLGDGVKLEMVWIEGGTFQMGSDLSFDEKPVRQVSLDGFWLGKYEVTQPQYERIMGHNPSTFKKTNNPVENVKWIDSVEFCTKLSQQTGQVYSLPSEAQWEYACRAGTTTAYSGGDSFKLGVSNVKNDVDSSADMNTSAFGTKPVGTFSPNAWGLYDMHGNVCEWCQDWYDEDFYSMSEAQQRNPVNNQIAYYLVLRGGSWYDLAPTARSAYRDRGFPDIAFYHMGLRIVRLQK